MALFSQLSWYLSSEWRRYVGAIFLLMVIAVLQVILRKSSGLLLMVLIATACLSANYGVDRDHAVLIALAVYLLRYIWRLWLFGASYQLAVKLRMPNLSPT